MQPKGFIGLPTLLAVIAVFILAAGGGVYFLTHNKNIEVAQPIQSTQSTDELKASPVSVPGMSQYTDSDFGFSFWYPSSWAASTGYWKASNLDWGNPMNGTKYLDIAEKGQSRFRIVEYVSKDKSIYEEGFSGNIRYFFDSNSRIWMVAMTASAKGSPDATTTADVSNNTMGGLHMFPGAARFGADTFVPLSASRFLIITTSNPGGPTPQEQNLLAETIVATDPSVAIPVGAEEQRQTVQNEKNIYILNQF